MPGMEKHLQSRDYFTHTHDAFNRNKQAQEDLSEYSQRRYRRQPCRGVQLQHSSCWCCCLLPMVSPCRKAENHDWGSALKTATSAVGVGSTDFSMLISHKDFLVIFFSLLCRGRRMLSANEKLCTRKERTHVPFTVLIMKAGMTSPG